MENKKTINPKDIDSLQDCYEAYMLCEEYYVPYKELKCLDDFKERLYLHYTAQKDGNSKTLAEETLCKIGEKYVKKREQLIKMFNELIKIVDIDEFKGVQNLLSKEGTTDDIINDCKDRIRSLEKKECVILVAGETSAGKSSLLNLLLGNDYLLTSAISCTCVITTVRYGERKIAKVIFDSPVDEGGVFISEKVIPLDENGSKELKEIIFKRGPKREEKHNIKEVQIFLPSVMLKHGLILADSPGIGENEFLEKYLMQYISEQQIHGFMYIIMSDSAGGVQEDRLLLLLKLILKQKQSSTIPFDPKAALFICNRFDAVPIEHREKVQNHILEKLSENWPEFDKSSAVFISTKNSKRDVDAHPDYINKEYKCLLQAFCKLTSISMDRIIKSSYKWIAFMLQRIRHYLKATVNRLNWTQRQREEESRQQKEKLNRLRTDADTVIKTLRADIAEKSKFICHEIFKYLETPQAKYMLCSVWKDDEILNIEHITSQKHWLWIKQRIDEAFYDRLCDGITQLGHEKCNVTAIETEIVDSIKVQLGVLENEIGTIEKAIDSPRVSINEPINEKTMAGPRKLSMGLSILKRLSVDDPTGGMEVPIKMNIKLTLRLGIFAKTKPVRTCIKNPQTYARKRSEKLLNKFMKQKSTKLEKGILEQIVEHLLSRGKLYLDKVEEKIPSIIDGNEKLLTDLEEMTMEDIRHLSKYEILMEKIETLKTMLMAYGDGYIFVHDFMSNEIKMLEQQHSGQSIAKTLTKQVHNSVISNSHIHSKAKFATTQGLWSIVNPGLLCRDDSESQISIRLYMPSSGIKNTFQEVAKLRCLLGNEVFLADFLGIHHTDFAIPAYIFAGQVQPLSSYMNQCSNPESVHSNILIGVAEGVQYLHSKGLVHMELSISTVTVNEYGTVRLTGACVPRAATLPLDLGLPTKAFVYMPIEVLQGELYITSADVYAYGLLVYELCSHSTALDTAKSLPLNEFIGKLKAQSILSLDFLTNSDIAAETVTLITQCVDSVEINRPKIALIADLLKQINGMHKKQNCNIEHDMNTSSLMTTQGELFTRKRRN